MKPTRFAIVVGAMKAGTTSLFELLSTHPQLAACSQKEPNFFSFDENHARGLEHYQQLWPAIDNPGAYALEASTTYTKRLRYPGVPERMREAIETRGLEIKLIYCLRHPIERIRSQLTHALRVEDKALNLHSIRDGWIEGHALEVSMYAHQLDAYKACFDENEILLLRFEEFVSRPVENLDRVAGFLGLDGHEWPPVDKPRNPSSGRYQKGALWKGLERAGLIKLVDAVPDQIKDPLREKLGQRMEGKVELTPTQKAFYRSALSHDLSRLEQAHGFDTSPWNLDPPPAQLKADRAVAGEPGDQGDEG